MNQRETHSCDELLGWLRERLQPHRLTVIGVDGAPKAGKTTLSQELSRALPSGLVSLDDCLDKHMGGFLNCLRHWQLKQEVSQLKGEKRVVVVEGVCLLAALERVGIVPDILVYVKRLSRDGFWQDDDLLPLNEVVKQYRGSLGAPLQPWDCDDLQHEVVDYHQAYCPQDIAEFVFSRTENS